VCCTGYCPLPTPDGGGIVCHYPWSYARNYVRYDINGEREWQRFFGWAGGAGIAYAMVTSRGEFIFAGEKAGLMYVAKMLPDPGMLDVSRRSLLPSAISLSAFPNPFNPTTTLSFTLPRAGKTKIVIYDITGREVRTLSDQIFEAGEHTLRFDGSGLPSGIYFARMTSGNSTTTQKLLLLK
jgi:hypothetical protein